MRTDPGLDDSPPGELRHCIGTDYGPGVANKRQTPQHTIAIDGDLWQDCLTIARLRHETLTSVLKRHLVNYRSRHKDLLDAASDE